MDLEELEALRDELTETEDADRYYIDPNWYEEHDLSFNDVIQGRFCPQCQERIGEEAEERYPIADRRTGRVTYEMRSAKYGSRPVAVVKECCSRKSGFIIPDMSVLEAVFRIMLANANQPMPLAHVKEQLKEWCPTGRCQWLVMPLDVLRQVVRGDRHYGLRAYELPDVA